jgi:hypothetical protein
MRSVIVAVVLFACYCTAQTFDPAQSFCTGGGISEGWTNNPSPFTLEFVDDQSQPFTSSPYPYPVIEGYVTDGVNVYPIDQEDNMDGTSSMWYTVPTIGQYQLYVYSGTTQVIGSPFSVDIYGPDGQETVIDGAGTVDGESSVIKIVVIHAKDLNGNSVPFGGDNFTVRAWTPNNQEITNAIFSDNNGIYAFTFTPEDNGTWDIRVYLDDVEIRAFTPVFTPN